MQELIKSDDYTPQILKLIETLKCRMQDTLIEFTDDQIGVFNVDGTIYILANPQLGEEEIFDENGCIKTVPMYNITLIHDKDWIKTKYDKGKYLMEMKQSRLRIFRPDLCLKINPDEATGGRLLE